MIIVVRKKIVLEEPEAREDLTVLKTSMATISFDGGKVELHLRKETASGSESVGLLVEFTLSEEDLSTIDDLIIGAAQLAEVVPAGEVS